MRNHRNHLRLPAAVVAGLLLLTGVGEAAGFGVCIHHGAAHHFSTHDADSAESSVPGSPRDPGSLGHSHSHGHAGGDAEPGDRAGAPEATGATQTRIPAVSDVHHPPAPDHGEACRILCAAAGTLTQSPTEGRPATEFLNAGGSVVSEPLVATVALKPTRRPHFLPPSQGPPVEA